MVKTPGVSAKMPKGEARPLGTKKEAKPKAPLKLKKAPGAKSQGPRPAEKEEKETSPAREAKPDEQNVLAKRRIAVVTYLMKRDEMPEEFAEAIMDGLSTEDIDALYNEAQASTSAITIIAQTEVTTTESNLVPSEDDAPVDFTFYPVLAESPEFAGWVLEALDVAKQKVAAEKQYKALKIKILELLALAGVPLDKTIMVGAHKFTPYEGSTPKQLDAHKLLELGVNIDLINKCYKSIKYQDVRMTAAKE